MNVLTFYKRLLKKGYKPPECHDHTDRGYCCAQAVIDFYDDFQDDKAAADQLVKHFLELDRRNVFRVWCKGRDNRFGDLWHGELILASVEYRRGKIDYCVDYLLQNP